MHIAALPRSKDERRERVNAVWSVDADQRAAAQGWYWMAHPMVRARINTLISGDPECDAYGRLERLYREQRWQLPIADAVSLGCGFGNLERDLAGRGLVRRIIAYDLAEEAVAQARRLAAEAGLTGLRYEVADLDALALPPASADAVFAHQSVHHVENLETLYATIRDALRPGGVFHLHEFVGPTRFQWTDAQLDLVNGLLDELPPRLRRLPSGAPKPAVQRPTVAEMIAADPSEAIRSADIPSALESCFEIVEARPIGGAVLHLALGDIAQNFDPNSAEDRRVLEHFFAVEDRAMREGVIGSDFVIITAVPRRATAAVFEADRTAEAQGSAVRRSLTLNTALLFPPVKRLHQAVRSLAAAVAGLSAEQARLRDRQNSLTRELAELSERAAGHPAAPAGAPLFVPPGHFYSPIVDPGEIDPAALRPEPASPAPVGITCDMNRMSALFDNLAAFFPRLSFPEQPDAAHRYYHDNGFYPYGDGVILGAMMLHFRPRRIIEVGSGFSSAVMLDVLDSAPELAATRCTFIDPYCDRLRTILRPGDAERVTVIEEKVQRAPLSLFEELAPGDFLFLDTTHVAKTGSDVLHEMFEILPRLTPGVFVHFHDMFDGFEYPSNWVIDENRSWNEIYLLRALLMWNSVFEIVFFNDRFARVFAERVRGGYPLIAHNAGGGLWLRKRQH